MGREPARSRPSLAGLAGTAVVFAGFVAGLRSIADNSFLTHLATGNLILDGHGVPRSDPYTFTVAGREWVAQSWFASVLYAGTHRISPEYLRLLVALTTAAIAAVAWQLTAAARTLLPRIVIAAGALAVGVPGWTARPYLLGLLGLSLALLAAEGRLRAPWLVPVGWIWMNTHGSWPLGVVALAAMAVGGRLDGAFPTIELRALRWLGLGLCLGVVNPYGIGIVTFPLRLLGRREALDGIVEWQPPRFDEPAQQAFVLLVVLAVAAFVRRRSWRAAVPALVFLALAATAARNVEVAAVVLLPGLAHGLSGLGSVSGAERPALGRAVVAAFVALGAAAFAVQAGEAVLDLRPYPLEATRFLESEGLDPTRARVVSHDFVGNFWELRYGDRGSVFVDDRVEVLTDEVILDYRRLLSGAGDSLPILDRYAPDAVLWEREEELAGLLASDPGWRVVHEDVRYLVAVPR